MRTFLDDCSGEPNGRASAPRATGRAGSPAAPAGGIRECRPEDFSAVAGLFSRVLRRGEKCNLATLESYLKELFFEHPWRDPELMSRVSESPCGAINGFIGVLPLRMTHRGKPIRAALASALMVDNPQQDPLTGARLLRSFLGGPQDLSISEHSNSIVERMWLRLGGSTVAAYSMDWVRILRPVQAGMALANVPPWLESLSRPVALAADALLGTSNWRQFRLETEDARVARGVLDTDQMAALAAQFAACYELAPAWDAAALRWFLKHAACKEAFGSLTGRVVTGRNAAPLGCYLYYGRPGGMALVLQIFSAPGHAAAVVASLLADAHGLGCAAVRGRSQPDLLDALLRSGCIFKQGASLTMHSGHEHLLAAIRAGDALVTGLAGESWTRMNRGQFH